MRTFISWAASGLMFLVIAWFAALLIFKSAFFVSFFRDLFHGDDMPRRNDEQEKRR
jgi:hypothetical protein